MATSWRERQAARRTQRNAVRTRSKTSNDRPGDDPASALEQEREFDERAPVGRPPERSTYASRSAPEVARDSRSTDPRPFDRGDFERPAPTRFRPSRFDPADRNFEHDRRREADEREAELHGDPHSESKPERSIPQGPRTVATLDLPKNLAMPELALAARVVAEALEDDVEVPHRERWKLYGMDREKGEQPRPERLFLEVVRFAEGTPVLFREPVSAVDTAAARLKEIKLIDLV